MKVYVVTCESFYASTTEVLAVCLTEDLAKKIIANDNTVGHFNWEYSEFEVKE